MTGPSPLIPDTPGRRRAWYHRSASLTSYPRDPGLTKLFHFHLALLLNYLNKMAKRVLLDRGAERAVWLERFCLLANHLSEIFRLGRLRDRYGGSFDAVPASEVAQQLQEHCGVGSCLDITD